MKEYNGENPQNARIKIDYSKKKPKIKFSYPVKKKDSETTGSMASVIFLSWILFNIPLIIFLGIIKDEEPVYKDLKEYEIESYGDYLEYYLQPERIEYYYNLNENTFKEIWREFFESKTLYLFIYLLGIPALIYFPFKKKWDKLYPDYMAWRERKKYKKFLIKDLRKNEDGFYLELPVFTNVVCDFNATKDFSKYMESFEIEEYKFEYVSRIKLKKEKQKKKNEIIWYARWYFKEKPTKGFLEVTFK